MVKYTNNLKEWQNELLVTTQEIADVTETTVGTVYNWLNGKTNMPIKRRKMFKAKYGVDPYSKQVYIGGDLDED